MPAPSKQGFFIDILDRLFKDASTGEVVFYRAMMLVLLFILAFAWYNNDKLFSLYKETRYDSYQEVLNKEKEKKFMSAAQEQLQIAHVSTGADFSAIFSYRPRNLNFFVDTITYEGKLPSEIDDRVMSGYPIDKTSEEYMTHLTGRAYESTTNNLFLPTRLEPKFAYGYSCPFFNLDNVYSGSISLFWKSPPKIDKVKIGIICDQAARTLGRIR